MHHPAARADLLEDDILGVLESFYARVTRDPLLGSYFANVDMPAHMPRIVDFWSTTIFHSGRYHGNAFLPHLEMPGLTSLHFARWLSTLDETVDEAHAGENAERMKALGHRIAWSMQLRLGIDPAGASSGEGQPPAFTTIQSREV